MRRAIRIVSDFMFYSFFIFGIVLFTFNLGDNTLLLFAFGSFFASWIIRYLFRERGFGNVYHYLIWVNLFLWLNLFGEIGLFYSGISFYDKFIHLTSGILISAILYKMYSLRFAPERYMVLLSAAGVFTLWEIYEYIIMTTFGFPSMGVISNGVEIVSKIDDTLIDMIFGTLGSIGFLVFKGSTWKNADNKNKA